MKRATDQETIMSDPNNSAVMARKDHDIRIPVILFAVSAGGVKRHVLDLAAGLDRSRFRVIGIFPDRNLAACVSGDAQHKYRAAFEALSLEYVILEIHREVNLGVDYRALKKLIPILRALKPVVLHCHSSKAGLIGRLAALRVGQTKVIYTPHLMYYTLHNGLKRFCFKIAEAALSLLSYKIIAVSKSEYDEYKRDLHLGGKIVEISNGVLPAAPPPKAREDVLKQFNLPEEVFLLVSPTRCEPQKDVGTLIEAMNIVVKTHPQAVLLVAGDGSQRGRLQARCRQLNLCANILFLGWVDDMDRYLGASDLVVLSSIREGMPYAVLEASAMARPVVGSDVPGIRDCIADGLSGFLFPAGDHEKLAELIQRFIADPELRLQTGRNGQKYIAEKHNLHTAIRRIEELYSAGDIYEKIS